MTLFCTVIKRDSVSLLRFLLLNHIQIILCQSPQIFRWQYAYHCFSSHFYFLDFLVLQSLAAGIGFHVNAHKTEYMCFNQTCDISTLNQTCDISTLKLVDKFTYLGSSVSSTRTDLDTRLTKAWTVIDRLSVIWKSDLTDKIKSSFFQAAVVSILLYGCSTWTLTKQVEKKLDGNYTRMLRAILNKSWRQHPSYTATYHPSRKLSKLDEPDMQNTAGEAGTSS